MRGRLGIAVVFWAAVGLLVLLAVDDSTQRALIGGLLAAFLVFQGVWMTASWVDTGDVRWWR